MPISKPDVTLNIIPAEQILGVNEHRVLIVGQKTTAGTATAGSIYKDVPDADNTINGLFGTRSILAEMTREFKKYNKITSIDALPVDDDGGATQATASIAVSGTASAGDEIVVSVGSDLRYKKTISVASGDTAATVATAIDTAFSDFTESPFQASATTGTVTFTAENGGTLANDWYISLDGTVAGLTFTVNGWSGGATDPSLTSLLDAVGNERYHTVIWPSVFTIATIQSFLDDRFNSSNDVLDGVAIQTISDTLSNSKTYVQPLNSQSTVVFNDKPVSRTTEKGSALRDFLDVVSAQAAALRALRLTPNGNLTQYLTSTARLDQFGGSALASLPYFNTALPNLPVPKPADDYTFADQDEFNDNGVSLIAANRAFNTTIFGEVVTTYLTDNAGNKDTSYKFLNTVDTMSVIRETFFLNYKNRYAQTRLTDADLIPGRDMANVQSIRAFSLEIYRSLADSALVQAGSTAEEDFLDNLSVSLDLSTGTATINMAPLLVTQLRAIVGTIQVNFGG